MEGLISAKLKEKHILPEPLSIIYCFDPLNYRSLYFTGIGGLQYWH